MDRKNQKHFSVCLASNTKLMKSLAHMPSPERLIFNVAKHAVMAWVWGIYCHFWLDCSASLNDKADIKCLKPQANLSFFLLDFSFFCDFIKLS